MASPAIEIASLSKHFRGGGGITDVSFAVPAGSVTGFIGVNGAGKSTTLRCILGLLEPDAGRVELFGEPISPSARRKIGFLPEERGLFPHERARDAIAFQGRLKGMNRGDALEAADHLLVRVGLGGRKADRLASLSKGNVQRVQILCALVHSPQLLLLDEPLSGLDLLVQSEMLSLLAEYRAKGSAILFSTHSMAAAESICDRVVMLSAGRTVFEGALADASKLAPHGAIVVTADVDNLAVAVEQLGAEMFAMPSIIGEASRWRVILPRHITHPALIAALAEHRVGILGFQPIQPNLEGAFWHLAESRPRQSLAA
jgi:ABC-2 type transport system ATP-binding protein